MILACSSGAFEQEVRSINGDSVILTDIPTSPLHFQEIADYACPAGQAASGM
jgi:hypothetical protein